MLFALKQTDLLHPRGHGLQVYFYLCQWYPIFVMVFFLGFWFSTFVFIYLISFRFDLDVVNHAREFPKCVEGFQDEEIDWFPDCG